MPILWRYLLKNYLKVFFLITSGFVTVLLLTRLHEIAKLAALNPNPKLLILFVLCQIPYILPIAMPISGLISALLLLNRLSQTHELSSLRASGLGLSQISSPLLMAAFLLSLINFTVVSELTPRCRLYSRELLHHVTTINPLFLMQKSKMLKLQDSYVDMNMTKRGQEAKEVIFVVKNQSNNRLTLMSAKSLQVKDKQLIGKDVAIISHVDTRDANHFDHLVIENQKTMSTSASALSELMRKPTWKVGYEHLTFHDIFCSAFLKKGLKPKHMHESRFELYRRLYFPAMTFLFTWMGLVLGVQTGRTQRKKGVMIAMSLCALTFVCSVAAKSFYLSSNKAALFYALPVLTLTTCTLWFQKQISRGRET